MVEGPGARFCVWVQGCALQCCGCAVPQSWNFDGGENLDTAELANKIITTADIEGVTFVGGEPFAQATALAEIGAIVKSAGLSVLTFTGYIYEDLLAENSPSTNALLDVTDLLIDGAYQKEFADYRRPWVGSSNQRYHFLTSRYRHLEAILPTIPNRLEMRLQPNGAVLVNGMGDMNMIPKICG